MNKRKLGKTGINVSEISFGGVEIGIPYGIGVKSQADMPTDAESINILHAALDKGINFFDTARAYGRSEEIIGKAFKSNRNNAIISTKCSHLPTDPQVLSDTNFVKKTINSSLSQSLTALDTDYIDVYMLHNAHSAILQNDTVLKTFSTLKKDGIIRASGVSTYTVEETQTAIKQVCLGCYSVIF